MIDAWLWRGPAGAWCSLSHSVSWRSPPPARRRRWPATSFSGRTPAIQRCFHRRQPAMPRASVRRSGRLRRTRRSISWVPWCPQVVGSRLLPSCVKPASSRPRHRSPWACRKGSLFSTTTIARRRARRRFCSSLAKTWALRGRPSCCRRWWRMAIPTPALRAWRGRLMGSRCWGKPPRGAKVVSM